MSAMLSQLSIRTKIISAMAIVLVAMLGLGALSIRQMQAINARTVDIQAGWLPSVRLLGELRAYTLTYRGLIRAHILESRFGDP
jgi:methyl-accepting chemotaxis protein